MNYPIKGFGNITQDFLEKLKILYFKLDKMILNFVKNIESTNIQE